MSNLTSQEKEKIIELIKNDQPLPSMYKKKLFLDKNVEYIEATKDYKLVYKNKERKEDIIANTPAAPLQKMRSFNSKNPFEDNWKNMLIYGDNLMALKAIYEDQRKDNKLRTKNRIKLIYIDPPFATKQDFMKDKEKAYRDKIIGAKFIEFLRKRLILLREILAGDGSIYVHLDWKKGHYIKAIMDEIFGEHNFMNDIAWCYTGPSQSNNFFPRKHDYIYFYKKNESPLFNPQYVPHKSGIHNTGQVFGNMEDENVEQIKELEQKGKKIEDFWTDIWATERYRSELVGYPTQKPEALLERIIKASSEKDDIILDAFAGSGTALTTAEKLNRRWIGIDSGKLALYTIQKRMLNLTNKIGSQINDDRREHERIDDFIDHSKMRSRGLFMVYEKARKGELVVNDKLLNDLATFLKKYMRTKSKQKFSLCCPEDKFDIKDLNIEENVNEYKAGDKIIKVGKIIFLISFIQEKNKPEEEKHLEAKEFALYNAGVYDFDKIKELDWQHYKNFVLQLFNVREEKEKVYGFEIDGYIGTYPVYVWNYPDKKEQRLDIDYIKSIHNSMEGKAGDKFYIIAPIISLEFMQDEVKVGSTTYTILKVPESILLKLMEEDKEGALKQPIAENDVNEVINAVGYDFISQPITEFECFKGISREINLFNKEDKDYVIKINKFKSNTLASDPDDFDNFETLSMVMVDTDFNDEYFELDKVFWADDLVNNELDRLEESKSSSFDEKINLCEFLVVRIEEEEFTGNKMMVIFVDKYGNEKKILLDRGDFSEC